jgi:D-glycero-D-manno-heptose 1,7-bisphosphate phosphatase
VTRAVFLDRDGVLIEDEGLLVEPVQIRVRPDAPAALRELADAGYRLVVISNQAVVARGLLTESQVVALHEAVVEALEQAGAPALDSFYFCPHHPNATLEAYRSDCECRKPRPGLILRAARELSLDLAASVLVGDRPTDVLAGALAGCRTVLVRTGRHDDPLIETGLDADPPEADYSCDDLAAAAEWILGRA